MLKLLQERKAVLEQMIAERFRQARAQGTTADVKQLSATLRAVKRQLASIQ
jgi:tRNA A37 N6-isopentenylltransferase MiaA